MLFFIQYLRGNNLYFHADVRVFMSNFWLEHSKEATIEMMMLDDKAAMLTQKEVPEILDLLPQYTGKHVLELGCGIGYGTITYGRTDGQTNKHIDSLFH